eukprot:1457261-Rhodomonas_salina.1
MGRLPAHQNVWLQVPWYGWRTQHKYPFTARQKCTAQQGLQTLSAGARQPTCKHLTVRTHSMPVLTRSRAAALATAPLPAVFCCADPNPRCIHKRSFPRLIRKRSFLVPHHAWIQALCPPH